MTPEENPLPDYYAILQVHPEAEADVIRAAYRLLMRKYHPDSLPVEQRRDLDILKRVRLINMAYDILSDPAQRAAYDAALKQQAERPSLLNTPGLDTRIHLVRCAQTHNTYKMLLARRSGSQDLFQVTGFELISEGSQGLPGHHPDEDHLALPEGREKANPLRTLLEQVLPISKKKPPPTVPPPQFPNQGELKALFDTSDALNFGEIDWAGFDCPSCHTNYRLPDGKSSHWCHCNGCARIYCSGKLHTTPLGVYGNCPWCGRMAKITRYIQPGEQVNMPVRAEVGRSEGNLPKLKDAIQPQLPNKRNRE